MGDLHRVPTQAESMARHPAGKGYTRAQLGLNYMLGVLDQPLWCFGGFIAGIAVGVGLARRVYLPRR